MAYNEKQLRRMALLLGDVEPDDNQQNVADVRSDSTVRSVRNKNPGNLRVGTIERGQQLFEGVEGVDDKGFAQFKDVTSGRKALEQQVRVDTNRNLTLGQFLDKYTPASDDAEGNRAAKANLSSALNVDLNRPLSQIDSAVLTRALTEQEGGAEALKFFYNNQQVPVSDNRSESLQFSDAELARMEKLLGGKDQSFLARLGRTAQKIPGDIKETAGEEFSALGEVISDPGQAISGIGMALEGTADIAGEKVFGSLYEPRDPRRAEMVRQMAGQFGEEIKNVEERPVRSLVNLASLATLPLTGGGAALARTAPRASKLLSTLGKAADVIDPVTAAAKGTGALYRGVRGKVSKAGEKVASMAEDTGAATKTKPRLRDAFGQVFDSVLGFTTGTSQTALERLRRYVGEGKGNVIRDFRKDKTKGRLRVVNKYIEDHKKIREQAKDDYKIAEQVMEERGLFDRALGNSNEEILTDLRNIVDNALVDSKASVKRGQTDPKLGYSKASLNFPYGGTKIAEPTQRKINEVLDKVINLDAARFYDDVKPVRTQAEQYAYETRLEMKKRGFGQQEFKIDADMPIEPIPEKLIDVRYLESLKKQLKDEINSIAYDDKARGAKMYLTKVHDSLAEKLNQATDGAHGELMRGYAEKMKVLDAADEVFSIDPRKAVEVADLKTRKGAYGSLASALGENPDELLNLEQFERIARESGGSGDLIASLVGSAFNPLFGGGLVVKSEISQLGRDLARLGGGIATTVFQTPAIALFSPRAVGAIVPRLIAGGMFAEDATRTARNMVKQVQAIGKKTGINKVALEGVTLGQLIERLNEDAELAQMIEDLEKGQN
jgi:hypothetical protein